ncbi:alpha-ketoglutarate-dependent dioxygenase AlkB [Myxococcota bacterium]|nr:alpha-ketoglutarate-dependent dioxygenase AlkB [Myxococcota bacterium]
MRVEVLPGVTYVPGFLADHEVVFTWAVADVPWDERIRARKTASFGVPYDYAGLTYDAAPFPPVLDAVRARVSDELGFAANNCLLNYYPDGDARMGWHSDSAMGLAPGSGVAIVSLGVARNLKFRRTAEPEVRLTHLMEPGSLMFMEDRVQREWQHALPRTHRRGPRVSLTFRAVVR